MLCTEDEANEKAKDLADVQMLPSPWAPDFQNVRDLFQWLWNNIRPAPTPIPLIDPEELMREVLNIVFGQLYGNGVEIFPPTTPVLPGEPVTIAPANTPESPAIPLDSWSDLTGLLDSALANESTEYELWAVPAE